ncbi:hypothetical protein Nepgr_016229 [Nepenthes gracilis]|uniref:Uncharacterized protein n=1 Tax=Nepenthes gracilis TaxID=150966 RepID=A0AAD3SMB7_NEPGR|nr:hypothetical protein Nepgr_016229 [Nepenthes gracilis]
MQIATMEGLPTALLSDANLCCRISEQNSSPAAFQSFWFHQLAGNNLPLFSMNVGSRQSLVSSALDVETQKRHHRWGIQHRVNPPRSHSDAPTIHEVQHRHASKAGRIAPQRHDLCN